ncbi:MAG: TonB-dependent receptor [Gammaproteobacteria bacterium]|nr:TonB-dependent receptor [Gammaproteobacteria bacterium]
MSTKTTHDRNPPRLKQAVGASLIAFATLPIGAGAAAAEVEAIEEVVVIGTRGAPRSVEDSSVPVDTISSEDFENQGGSDMSNLIRALVPSFHVNDNPSRDLAALLRPVNLRGLAPDHTLVLMNNKRRHRGSVIQWISNGASNGAQGPDISAIPAIAIKRMEVLRDGAAAQYGSDAIAGVLNFVLKDAAEGFSVEAKHGFYVEDTGEDLTTLAGNAGLPLGDAGFVNLSLELGQSSDTERSVQHRDAAALMALGIPNVADPAKPWGSPKVSNSIKAVANIGMDINDGTEFYAFGNFASREVETPFFFRSPMNRNGLYKTSDNIFLTAGDGCQDKHGLPSTADNLLAYRDAVAGDPGCFSFVELYPEGFTPAFGAEMTDYSLFAGVKGGMQSGLLYDVSASIGENNMDGFLNNSLNPSLGAGSPRDFDIGEYTQQETNFNIDLSYPVDVGLASDLNIAGGFEWREEEFNISTGERASWEIGPYQQYGFSTGSNGFGGFNPASSGTWDRANIATYLDLEVNATDNWRIGGALRWEDFDGFGSTTNFKFATHLQVTDVLALRGSFGTGFRAPTPGQSNARNVSTVVNAATNAFEERGTIGSTHPVAMALGGRELEPEESDNLTLGAVLALDNGLSLTVDYFRIDVDDRIALSGLFDVTGAIKQALIADGVPEAAEFTSVRYFTNDFDTETEGVDVVLTYGWETDLGSTDLLMSFNHTNTKVRNFRPGSTIAGGDTIDNLERGAPETRFNLTLAHSVNNWYLVGRYSYFGEWYDDHSAAEFDGYGLVDLLAQYNFASGMSVSVGAENALDEYPDKAINAGNGRKYPRYSPAGHNGALIYAKISYSM